MKVLEVTNVDFSLHHFLLPLMRAAAAGGHEVIGVCADGPLLAPIRAEGLRVESLPMARSLSPAAQWRAFRALIRLIRAERPDIVHAHMPIAGFLARVAARLCRVPLIAYTGHGFLFNQPGPPWRRLISLLMEWSAGQLTDVYTTVSTEEAADARRLHIHPRAVGIGNGRDPARFAPNPAARARIRATLGCADDQPVILIVSRLVRHKGYPELLAAMADIPGAELWVAGDRLPSDHGPDLEPLFAAANLGPRLRRLGYRPDIADILAAADIFVLPSHFEGLPMSVIEAMLTALPVVATDIRGPREQITTGETGLLVPPAQVAPLAAALRQLVADPSLRTRLGAAARRHAVATYDESIVLSRTLALLGLTPPPHTAPNAKSPSQPGEAS